MENLILSINTVLPLFVLILLGFFLRRIHLIDESMVGKLNSLIFKCFLPLLLFWNIYQVDLAEVFNGRLIALSVGAAVSFGILLCLIVPIFEKDNKKRGVIAQAGFRSNFVLFGIPLAVSLVGEENIGPTSLMVAVVVPTVNVMSVIILEIFRGEKIRLKPILKGIVTNPLVIAAVIAVFFQLIHLKLPVFLEDAVSDLAGVGTPLALLTLGAAIHFEDVRLYPVQITAGVFFKLILEPLIFIPIAVAMGFRGPELVPFIVMCASPTAVSSYTMAEQVGADGKLASQLVFYSTGLSVITIFIIIFVTKSLGLF